LARKSKKSSKSKVEKKKKRLRESKKKKKRLASYRQKRHFKKVTKLTNSLTSKSALQFHLKQLRPDMNPRTQQDTLLAFKNTVQVVLAKCRSS
jgi:hypothetical protein